MRYFCEPHGNHERKICSRCPPKVRNMAYYYRKSSNHKGRQQERQKRIKRSRGKDRKFCICIYTNICYIHKHEHTYTHTIEYCTALILRS